MEDNNEKIKYKDNELITVIMPVYNAGQFLSDSINSVINQTYKKWELIIINDGSTDNSLDLINTIIKKQNDLSKSKIKIINSKNNEGAASARNKGLNIANGRYISFLDADDVFKKEKLEKQYNFINKNNYCFTYTNVAYLKNTSTKDVKNMPKSLNYNQSLKNTFISMSTVMIDTKNIAKDYINMPNIEIGEDTATWRRILKNGYVSYGVDEILTVVRKDNPNSVSHKKIKAIKGSWNLYRKVENMNIFCSFYYFIFYLVNAIKKRIL